MRSALTFARYCALVLALYACAAAGMLCACAIADAAHNVSTPGAFALVGRIAAYTAALILMLSSAGVLFFAPIALHPRNT